MIRFLSVRFLIRMAGVASFAAMGIAMPFPLSAQDLIRYRPAPDKPELEKECEILSDSPRGVKVKIKNEREAIELEPPLIVYLLARVPGKSLALLREPIYRAQQAERELAEADRTTHLRLAIQNAEECLKQVEGTAAARGWALFVARLHVWLAETEPAQTDLALTILARSKAVLESGWTDVPSLMLQAQLQQAKGDNEGAQMALGQLANRPGITPFQREQILGSRCRLLVRSGKFPECLAEIAKLQDPASKTILQLAIEVARNQPIKDAETRLPAAVAKSTDSGLKALGCNLLGELLLKAERKDDAFWEFLKVETLFPQDRVEEARALYHLSSLYDSVRNDPARALQSKEKLKRPFFAGTEYQARIR